MACYLDMNIKDFRNLNINTLRIIVLTALWISTCFLSFAQTKPKPKVLQSGKILPNDFTTDSSTKYEKEIKQISKNAKRKDAKNQDKFYLESNFLIDDFLKSGYVLFDDPASKYITKVGKKILDQIPSRQRPQIRFYAVKSSAVNAFATNSGLVFVNVGLLARLENEAQLAFILAHEITHVMEKHNLDLFLEQKKIEKGEQRDILRGRDDVNANLMKRNNYSRELEFEADEGGIEYFLKTDYNLQAALDVFEILRRANLPATNDKFDWSYFEDEGLRFPKGYVLEKVQSIGSIKLDDDDSSSTHPSIDKRKGKIREEIGKKENTNKMDFLVSEKSFNRLKKQAKHSMIEYYLRDFDYYNVIYTANTCLADKELDHYMFEYSIGQALSALTKLRNENEFSNFRVNLDDVEGESQQVYKLINALSAEETNVLAMNYLWRLVDKYPKDDMVLGLANNVTQDYVLNHEKDFKKFRTTSKFEKEEERAFTSEQFVNNALVTTFKNPKFKSTLVKNKRAGKRSKDYEDRSAENEKAFEKLIKKRKFALGQKKVIVVNPFYQAINFRKKRDNYLFLESEEKQEWFRGLVQECAKKNGVRATILDASDINRNSSSKFIDQGELNAWFSQLLTVGGMGIDPYNQAAVEGIAKKYGTDYVMWTGTISGRTRGRLFLETIVNYFWNPPWAVIRLFKRPHVTTVVTMVANVKTKKINMVNYATMKATSKSGVLGAHVYDSFYQLQKRPKR